MNLSRRDYLRGKENFTGSLGLHRRDFLRATLAAPSLGALYFGYTKLHGPPVRAGIVGTGNEGCDAMIKQSPPDFLQYVAYHDIRPSNIKRAREKAFPAVYSKAETKKIVFHDKWESMLADPNLEAIVIATPLHTHAKFAIEAMEAGKHVFCEKLMAHNITDAKAMVRMAEKTGKLLGIGHQRHYSTLYADALRSIQAGTLGDICHIRALWHRNNAKNDSWTPPIPEDDKNINFTQFGYKKLEHLIRWRLYNYTGGGLMAELGSHQLDACSIFLNHAHPRAVSAVGGKYFFDDDRECEDHVYCTFEMPDARNHDKTGVIITYSSINTNAIGGYGECVMGTRGTMMVMHERDVLLFNENDPLAAKRESKKIESKMKAGGDEPTMYSAASLGLPAQAAKKSTGEAVSRGYKEELEHFAYCIRNPGSAVRCDGKTALADAVMALTSIQSMRERKRIEFKDAWYDPNKPDVPDPLPEDMSLSKKA